MKKVIIFAAVFVLMAIGTIDYFRRRDSVSREKQTLVSPAVALPILRTDTGVRADDAGGAWGSSEKSQGDRTAEADRILAGNESATGREVLKKIFKQWGQEAPYAAIAFLAAKQNEAIGPAFRNQLLNQVLAGWVLVAPDDAWEWGRKSTSSAGESQVRLGTMITSLTELGRFDEAGGLIGDDAPKVSGSAIQNLAMNWIASNPGDGGRWVDTLSGVARLNGSLGAKLATAKADVEATKAELSSPDGKDAGLAATALVSLPAREGFSPARILAEAPDPGDGRFGEAIVLALVHSGPAAEAFDFTTASALLDKLSSPERRTFAAKGYVVRTGAMSPTDGLAIAQKYLGADQTISVFTSILNRAAMTGQSSEKIFNALVAIDPTLSGPLSQALNPRADK